MKHLLIDDFRSLPADKICRNYNDGIEALQEHWDVLWLDHDLGEEKTGYDIICWIEENAFTGSIKKPEIIICISDNPVGRNKINSAIKRMYGLIFDERHVIALESQLKLRSTRW